MIEQGISFTMKLPDKIGGLRILRRSEGAGVEAVSRLGV
jgi:hypothetical protein